MNRSTDRVDSQTGRSTWFARSRPAWTPWTSRFTRSYRFDRVISEIVGQQAGKMQTQQHVVKDLHQFACISFSFFLFPFPFSFKFLFLFLFLFAFASAVGIACIYSLDDRSHGRTSKWTAGATWYSRSRSTWQAWPAWKNGPYRYKD